MKHLTASIVAYKNNADVIAHAIHSFLTATTHSTLFLIDNSPTDRLKYLAYDKRIRYHHNEKNIGFGRGHNIALRSVLSTSRYHLVLNPDVYFDADVIWKIYAFMEEHPDVGHLMPKVFYPSGDVQHLCKLLPSPRTLLLRRFLNFLSHELEKENEQYELHGSGYDKIMDVPFLSGCFMFLRTAALQKVGLFDERFFLYTEDTDLSRRIHRHFRTVFFPEVTIYHHHERGSYKSFGLMLNNIFSAIRYFNKWGWMRDQERDFFNHRALTQIANRNLCKA